MSLFQKFFLSHPDFARSTTPVITLLYDHLPVNDSFLDNLRALAHVENEFFEPELSIESHWRDGKPLLAEVSWQEHIVEVAGIFAPVPTHAMERCVWPSLWRPDLKELMASHKHNIILKYAGDSANPIEQYIALYKLANVFPTGGLLGVLNEPAWCCHPAQIIPNIMDSEMLQVMRDSPPLLYWTGFLSMRVHGYLWCFSRGNHLFHLPDFVVLAGEEPDGLEIQNLFHEVFTYLYFNDKKVGRGDIVGIDEDHAYEVLDLDEELKDLAGVGETYILHPLSAEDADALAAEIDAAIVHEETEGKQRPNIQYGFSLN